MKATKFKFQNKFSGRILYERTALVHFFAVPVLGGLLGEGIIENRIGNFCPINWDLKINKQACISQNQAIKELFCTLSVLYIDIYPTIPFTEKELAMCWVSGQTLASLANKPCLLSKILWPFHARIKWKKEMSDLWGLNHSHWTPNNFDI